MYSTVILDDVNAGMSINDGQHLPSGEFNGGVQLSPGFVPECCTEDFVERSDCIQPNYRRVQEQGEQICGCGAATVIVGTKSIGHGCDSWLLPEASGG